MTTEHTYPARMPKDDPRSSVQLAWRILDSVRPGMIPPLVRFNLADKIQKAVGGIDDLGEATQCAIELADYFINMDPEKMIAIAGIDSDLAVRLARLTFLAKQPKI